MSLFNVQRTKINSFVFLKYMSSSWNVFNKANNKQLEVLRLLLCEPFRVIKMSPDSKRCPKF